MNTPRLLLFRGQGFVSKLIKWQTNGAYSHAAIQLPNGRIIEAWHSPAKVRLRGPLQDWNNVEAYDVEDMTADQWDKAVKWATKQIGKGYDFGGVFRFVTRWRKEQDEKWFCSELVFQAIKEGGVDLLERIQCSQVSPTVLSFSPLLTDSEPYRSEVLSSPPKAIIVPEP